MKTSRQFRTRQSQLLSPFSPFLPLQKFISRLVWRPIKTRPETRESSFICIKKRKFEDGSGGPNIHWHVGRIFIRTSFSWHDYRERVTGGTDARTQDRVCSSRSEQRATLKMLRNKLSSRGLDTKEEEKDSDSHLRRHWVCVFSSYRGVSASARSDQSRKRESPRVTRDPTRPPQ